MYSLPKSILVKIYEFDSTYKIIYNKVMDEFVKSTPYWCMASNLRINNKDSFLIYRMTYKQAKEKSEFWNERYNQISLLKNKNNNIVAIVAIVLPEFISDIYINYPYFRDKKIIKKVIL